jgi:hypothetical protein
MARRKATFTLDVETVTRLRRASERLSKPQSQVVREAIREYSDRIAKLSEGERLALLERFDDLVPRIPRRPLSEVERELQAIREARRASGRRTRGKRRS